MLASVADRRLRNYRAKKARSSIEQVGLVEFVPCVSPELEAPKYLAPYAEQLEVACAGQGCKGEIRAVVAAPPQHGKTQLTLRAYLWWDVRFPGKRHCYVTYNADRSLSVARNFWLLAETAGFEPTGTLEEIRLRGGSTVKFTSIGGSLTGYPIDGVCIIDDPIKGPEDAFSGKMRQGAVDWFDSVAHGRRHKGTSFIVMATRWHVADPSGQLIKRGWPYINLKAIAEGDVDAEGRVISDPLRRQVGESLWHRKPPEFFDDDRKKIYWWASQFQGEPRPVGGHVFNEPALYRRLPDKNYRVAFGIDLAYTAKTHADYSVLIEIWREETADPKKANYYVVNVDRKQVEAPSFTLTLKARYSERKAPMRWYASSTEKGSADFIKRQGIPLEVLPPKGDKFVRAQPVAAAWNDGRVMVPDNDPAWLPALLDEVLNFTGVQDVHDDQVDALAAGFDALNRTGTVDLNRVADLWGQSPTRRM